ncbi:MAG: 30S ribosomal protein S4 [Thermoguttaceae bacterium]|nr:30S ribosomal protein S4 [Thermoguttaceae bacterium]
MARTLGPVCKRCRREGVKLFLKGTRCDSPKCPFNAEGRSRDGKNNVLPPGMHGFKRGKMTEYGEQLREKQKVKTYYGVLEAQFRKYYGMAERSKGNTGQVLMSLLERRLDNVVHRLGFAVSRAQARQMISHGHICVNGRRLDVASYLVRPGDVISVKVYKRDGGAKTKRPGALTLAKDAFESMGSRAVPEFLARNDGDVPSGTVLRNPVFEDVSLAVEPQLIVELCSK